MSFWDFFWLMIWGFLFICYLMVLFQVIVDLFRNPALKGWAKAIWIIALLLATPLTALVYVLVHGRGMGQRETQARADSQASVNDYIRSVSASAAPADQIEKAKTLLDSGTITPDEFQQLKARALA